MRIGIITWWIYNNFGSKLQAYALQKYLLKKGYDVELVDYVRHKKLSFFTYVKRLVKRGIKFFLTKVFRYNFAYHSRYFTSFTQRYLHGSKRHYDDNNIGKVESDYDLFIAGSDQIWAPNVFNPRYFLDFVKNKNKKISYAASVGLNDIPEELRKEYKNLLSSFAHISVREYAGKELLKKQCDIDVDAVLDPSFLLSKDEWKQLIKVPSINEKYVFCYFLGQTEWHRKYVSDYAKEHGYKLIITSKFDIDTSYTDIHERWIGPQEFLGYIKNAAYVFTDSFHGLVFSIIFQKEFYVFKRFTDDDKICQNSRVYNILDIIHQRERLILSPSYNNQNPINHMLVQRHLDVEIQKSKNYLDKCLKERENNINSQDCHYN